MYDHNYIVIKSTHERDKKIKKDKKKKPECFFDTRFQIRQMSESIYSHRGIPYIGLYLIMKFFLLVWRFPKQPKHPH